MILPERVLGSASVKRISSGFAIGPICVDTWSRSAGAQVAVRGGARARRHERDDRGAGQVVGPADHRGLGDARVRDERALDLHRADPVARDVHHVVDAAHDPEVAVRVAMGAVAREVDPARSGSSTAPCSAWDRPRCCAASPATASRSRGSRPWARARACRCSSKTSASMPGNGRVAEPGLRRDLARQRRDHDPAGLGLPPRVDDRAALAADHAVVPDPRLGVDRLADRAEQAQRREVVLVRVLVAEPDERADRRRRGVEDASRGGAR